MSNITFSENDLKVNTKSPYYLGLDVGVGSVGYAITDSNYEVIRRASKSLWGAHLFKEAETKAERRAFRSARRRRKREKERIRLLQVYFDEAVSQKDPGFFRRMKDSFFVPEDKAVAQRFSLFNDPDYTDQDYYEEYPTIYHLRYELMKSDEPHDVRLVYLALHHIMKNRGHFLKDQMTISEAVSVQKALDDFEALFTEFFNDTLFRSDAVDDVLKTLLNPNLNSSDQEKILREFLNSKDKSSKAFCKLLAGNLVRMKALFPDLFNEDNEEEGKIPVKFNDGYEDEEMLAELETAIGEYKALIDAAYNLFASVLLHSLLRKNDHESYGTLSEARIAIYERHGEDLRLLKRILKDLKNNDPSKAKWARETYNRIFRENKKKLCNYVAYSGHTDDQDDMSPEHNCSQEDFLKFLKKELKPIAEDLAYEDMFARIENGSFMPRIRSKNNGIIPRQLNEAELIRILDRASGYLNFLTDEVKSEIRAIFNFKIPYYIGPFDDRSEFAWLKRKSNEAIRPWNLEEVVDIPETATAFIKQMTSKCTYLIQEDVLPKNSLIYSEYLARNAINNLTWNGHRLSDDVREKMYWDLFRDNDRSGRLTRKRVLNYLHHLGFEGESACLGGMDQDIPVKLKSYHHFREYLEAEKLSRRDVEDIIEKLTVFPDSRELIRSWLQTHYGEQLDTEDIDRISRLRYTDWGRFSKRFLTGLKCNTPTGQRVSILDVMRQEPLNLMEVLYDPRFCFMELIEKENNAVFKDPRKITDDDLDLLELSPPVRKGVRKTLLLCQELFDIMGGAPQKLFLEMPREHRTEKRRTISRKKRIEDLYGQLKEECSVWTDTLSELPAENFRSKALYLYAIQRGRCLYSGDIIPYRELFDRSKYDIDHIYPHSLTKDDSFNNLALVKKEMNQAKGDCYPISSEIRRKMEPFWFNLLRTGFMTEEKYRRLTRNTPLTAEELERFVGRQLVETRQSSKVIANLLRQLLPDTEVVYVKAGLVSDFRYNDGLEENNKTHFYFPKVRVLNDLHHAKDAYLNIVVGNVYHEKFTKKFYLNLREGERQYNLTRLFDFDIPETWRGGDTGTIITVKENMARNNALISYESRRQKGGLFDQMIVKKGEGQYPIKSSIPALHQLDRYGAYNKVSASHFCVASAKRKNKDKIIILPVPATLAKENFSEASLVNYIVSQGYQNPEILCPEVKYGAIIKLDGLYYRLIAKTGSSIKCGIPLQAYYSPEKEVVFKELEREDRKESDQVHISGIDLTKIIKELAERLINSPYGGYSAMKNQGEKILASLDVFEELSDSDKIEVIFSVARLLSGAGETVDLSKIYTLKGEKTTGKQSGLITIQMMQKPDVSLSIVDQSISGFFENERVIN